MTDRTRPSGRARWHGTAKGYNSYHCRCDDCRNAVAEAARARRARRMEERIIVDGNLYHPAAEHGTKNGYQNFCCRCPECKAAWSRSMNEYLRRRKIRNQGLGGAQ